MATHLVFNAIALEALKNDNYSNWSACIKNYLIGQDLWDVIKTVPLITNVATTKSFLKNAMALHAIQISCGPDMLSKIREINTARDAWDTLAKMHEPQTQGVSEPESSSGDQETVNNDNVDYAKYLPLLNALETGEWDAVKEYLDSHRNEYRLEAKITSDGFTILHLAALKGHVKIVQELVQLMSKESLEVQIEHDGWTALSLAILGGFDEMVFCMVEKDRELVSIAIKAGALPVEMACRCGNKRMTRYLYRLTPLQDLTSRNGANGAALLNLFLFY